MITITLNQIRNHGPCKPGWGKLLAHFGKTKADDEPFPFSEIVRSNGVVDGAWALRCLEDKTPARLFAVSCAQSVLHLMEDERGVEAVKTAHLFAHGEVSRSDIYAAAADAADAAADAADAAAYAAADAAAYAAADAAAYAAYVADAAAYVAADAAAYVAYVAADAAEHEKQVEWLIAIADRYEK